MNDNKSTRTVPEMLYFLRSEAEEAILGITRSGQPLSFAERVAKAMAAATQLSALIEENFALRKEVSELKDRIEELAQDYDKVMLDKEKSRAKVRGQNKNDEGQ